MERLESKRGIPGKRLRRILKVLKKIYRNSRHGKITAGPKLYKYLLPSNKHGLDGGVSGGGGDLNHTLKTEHRKKMVHLVGKPCCNEHTYSAGRPTRRVQWEGTSPSSRHSGNKTRGVPSHKGTAEVGPPPASRCLARSPPPTA
ncbi:hypothetical protein BDFG_02642 [Blastomyces dermatitidis ATCC 26199]|nr:hypothetical protein BDFG_02642 [Blastomyces dermatitidis ATCC 26199]